jgi:hypothetical protein
MCVEVDHKTEFKPMEYISVKVVARKVIHYATVKNAQYVPQIAKTNPTDRGSDKRGRPLCRT